MALIPVSKQQQADGVVLIDERRRQLIGVRTSAVTSGALRRSFKAVGHVTYDESTFTDVNLKVRGWINRLLVNETGQRVARGQVLFSMYSPELYSAEQDFLLASRDPGSPTGGAGSPRALPFARAARTRLNLLGLSDAQIDALSAQGEPRENTTVSSPASGFIIEKNVVEGASVEAGTRLFRIAALNKVWVEADVYEADLGHVRVGQPAKVTLDYLPEHAYDAKVSYVYPYLEAGARTGRVRIELSTRGSSSDLGCTRASSCRRSSVRGYSYQPRRSSTPDRGGWCSSTWARADFDRKKCASVAKPGADTRSSRACRRATRSRPRACF